MKLFDHLMQSGWMPLRRLPDVPPPLEADPARLAGMLWGVYLGDALGNASESQAPATRRQRYGEISTYVTGRGRASDDSQLAFWTLEHLLEHGSVRPQKLARRFASEPVRGLGRTVRAFLAGVQAGLPWQECAVDSLGNGSLMRIAPVVAPFLRTPEELFPNVAVAAALTHRSPGAVATCLAFTSLLRELLALSTRPGPAWYSQRFLETLEECCPDADYVKTIRETVATAVLRDIPVLELRSGASLLETVPALLLLLDRYGHDPVQCVTRAVNDTYDNDSLAAMTAACMGAQHGLERFPAAWLTDLEPTVSALSRPVTQLVAQATARWAAADADWELIRARLGALRVGAPISYGALHLVPLLGPDLPNRVHLLEEAPSLQLSEVGRVDALQGCNQGQRPVLLLDGEALTGGLQNRMLRSHVLIGTAQTVDLPVMCVEQQRWGARREIRAARNLAPPSVRRGGNQSEVWQQVETQLTKTRATNRTKAMQSAFTRVDRLSVAPLKGQVGVLALLGGQVLCLEVVGSHELYARVHEKLMASLAVESYRVEAAWDGSRRDAAEDFLELVRGVAGSKRRPDLGLGSGVSFTSDSARGQALLHEGQVLCLSAFPA